MVCEKLNFDNGDINFCQSRSDGFPVVFVHGNSMSANTFIKQFEDPLLSEYRLLALDFPGHGESGKWKNPHESYSAANYVKILVEFTFRLNLFKAVFVGHSLGGHIVLHAAEWLHEASGFMFFGITPFTVPPRFDEAFLPNPAAMLLFKSTLTESEINQLCESLVKKGEAIPGEITDSVRKSDPAVRDCIAASISSGEPVDETALLQAIPIPVSLLHGEHDQLVNLSYLEKLEIPSLWNNKIGLIPDAGHSPQTENPKIFNNYLLDFLNTGIK